MSYRGPKASQVRIDLTCSLALTSGVNNVNSAASICTVLFHFRVRSWWLYSAMLYLQSLSTKSLILLKHEVPNNPQAISSETQSFPTSIPTSFTNFFLAQAKEATSATDSPWLVAFHEYADLNPSLT